MIGFLFRLFLVFLLGKILWDIVKNYMPKTMRDDSGLQSDNVNKKMSIDKSEIQDAEFTDIDQKK